MSDLYFNEERDYYSDENTVTIKSFVPPFFNHFSLNLNQKKLVVMRAMRKKLNIFALQLPREASRHSAFMGIWSTIRHTR